MSTRNNVILLFDSNRGEKVRLTIPRADMTLTEARARATMEDMIDAGTVLTTAGFPTAIRSAKIESTVRTPLVSA